jgi:hypothetical protein
LIAFGIDRITLAKINNSHPKHDLRRKGMKPGVWIIRMGILPNFGAMVIMPSFDLITADKFCARVLILSESA